MDLSVGGKLAETVQSCPLLIHDTQQQERRRNTEKGGIASTGGITSIWLYLAACLASGVGTAFIFLLPCFIYPLSRQKIEKSNGRILLFVSVRCFSFRFFSGPVQLTNWYTVKAA